MPEPAPSSAHSSRIVHVVEQGGHGGVHQHAVAIVDLLSEAGHDVTLHTADEPELLPRHASVCHCVRWERNRPGMRFRRTRILWSYIVSTLPHLYRAFAGADVVHVQGRFKVALGTVTYLFARMRSIRSVASPHNTFTRGFQPGEALAMRADLRLADAVIVFSHADRDRLASRGISSIVSPLIHAVPTPEPTEIAEWKAAWKRSEDQLILLFAGQIRSDKRLDLAVEVAARLDAERWRLAVVGADLGPAGDAQQLARRLGVDASWHIEWPPVRRFAAAIAAADVVICPYDMASSSGVIDLANRLGTATVARGVGGLNEIATVTVASASPRELADAVQAAALIDVTPTDADDAGTLAALLEAYTGSGRPEQAAKGQPGAQVTSTT